MSNLALTGAGPEAAVVTQSAYVQAVLADAPAGYWRLNDTSGTVAVDSSGNGNNGTYSGAFALNNATLLTTGGGACVNFTGGQMAIGNVVALQLGSGPLSVEVWVNASTIPSYAALFDNGTSSATRAYSVFLNAGGVATSYLESFGVQAAGGDDGVGLGATFATATTFHLVFTRSGTTVTAYVNGNAGTPHTMVNASAGTNSSTGVTLLGNPSTGGGILQAKAQDFAVYPTALSAARVAAHFAAR